MLDMTFTNTDTRKCTRKRDTRVGGVVLGR